MIRRHRDFVPIRQLFSAFFREGSLTIRASQSPTTRRHKAQNTPDTCVWSQKSGRIVRQRVNPLPCQISFGNDPTPVKKCHRRYDLSTVSSTHTVRIQTISCAYTTRHTLCHIFHHKRRCHRMISYDINSLPCRTSRPPAAFVRTSCIIIGEVDTLLPQTSR
jgi:hypothetical protein